MGTESTKFVSWTYLGLLTVLIPAIGCWTSSPRQVVVYTALDREFSEPIFRDFTDQTGIIVLPKYDTESTKTVGLTNGIIAEKARPRCDVFWNNEILNTLRLEQLGLIQAYVSPHANDFPENFRSEHGNWYGFAARARVLIVNTELLTPDQFPKSITDLIDPRWKRRVGIANPLFGTTATHAACLFAYWGDDRSREYFLQLRENARVEAGNKQVALAVAGGQLAFGLTDTDDAIIELEKGLPVTIVYPDQGQDEMGTLFIPNTASIIQGSRHTTAAKSLVDFLLSGAVETKLAAGPSAQIPLSTKISVALRVESLQTVKAMKLEFAAAARKWNSAARFLREEFVSAE